jgi:hypothetical protein
VSSLVLSLFFLSFIFFSCIISLYFHIFICSYVQNQSRLYSVD